MDITQVLAVWVHALALVIVMGYYGVLGRIVIPALERSLDGPALASALEAVERRALPLLILSVTLFVLTGTYLLVINPQYEGLGKFFTTTWSTLMVAKHVVVIGLVGFGVLVDFFVRDVPYAADETARARAVRRVGLCAEVATGFGALAILMTAAAQLSA